MGAEALESLACQVPSQRGCPKILKKVGSKTMSNNCKAQEHGQDCPCFQATTQFHWILDAAACRKWREITDIPHYIHEATAVSRGDRLLLPGRVSVSLGAPL